MPLRHPPTPGGPERRPWPSPPGWPPSNLAGPAPAGGSGGEAGRFPSLELAGPSQGPFQSTAAPAGRSGRTGRKRSPCAVRSLFQPGPAPVGPRGKDTRGTATRGTSDKTKPDGTGPGAGKEAHALQAEVREGSRRLRVAVKAPLFLLETKHTTSNWAPHKGPGRRKRRNCGEKRSRRCGPGGAGPPGAQGPRAAAVAVAVAAPVVPVGLRGAGRTPPLAPPAVASTPHASPGPRPAPPGPYIDALPLTLHPTETSQAFWNLPAPPPPQASNLLPINFHAARL